MRLLSAAREWCLGRLFTEKYMNFFPFPFVRFLLLIVSAGTSLRNRRKRFYCSARKKNAEIKIKINGIKFIVPPSTLKLNEQREELWCYFNSFWDVSASNAKLHVHLTSKLLDTQRGCTHCCRVTGGWNILELLPVKNRFERIPFKPLSLFDQFEQHTLWLVAFTDLSLSKHVNSYQIVQRRAVAVDKQNTKSSSRWCCDIATLLHFTNLATLLGNKLWTVEVSCEEFLFSLVLSQQDSGSFVNVLSTYALLPAAKYYPTNYQACLRLCLFWVN